MTDIKDLQDYIFELKKIDKAERQKSQVNRVNVGISQIAFIGHNWKQLAQGEKKLCFVR